MARDFIWYTHHLNEVHFKSLIYSVKIISKLFQLSNKSRIHFDTNRAQIHHLFQTNKKNVIISIKIYPIQKQSKAILFGSVFGCVFSGVNKFAHEIFAIID